MCDVQASDIQASPRPLAWTGDIQASARGLSGR
jgi:hypothetical protein